MEVTNNNVSKAVPVAGRVTEAVALRQTVKSRAFAGGGGQAVSMPLQEAR